MANFCFPSRRHNIKKEEIPEASLPNSLPPQSFVKHPLFSISGGHSLPPFIGRNVTVRVLRLKPMPHRGLQGPQSDHGETTQSCFTAKKIEENYWKLLFKIEVFIITFLFPMSIFCYLLPTPRSMKFFVFHSNLWLSLISKQKLRTKL